MYIILFRWYLCKSLAGSRVSINITYIIYFDEEMYYHLYDTSTAKRPLIILTQNSLNNIETSTHHR